MAYCDVATTLPRGRSHPLTRRSLSSQRPRIQAGGCKRIARRSPRRCGKRRQIVSRERSLRQAVEFLLEPCSLWRGCATTGSTPRSMPGQWSRVRQDQGHRFVAHFFGVNADRPSSSLAASMRSTSCRRSPWRGIATARRDHLLDDGIELTYRLDLSTPTSGRDARKRGTQGPIPRANPARTVSNAVATSDASPRTSSPEDGPPMTSSVSSAMASERSISCPRATVGAGVRGPDHVRDVALDALVVEQRLEGPPVS